MSENTNTFSIEVRSRNGERYKSISSITWDNIPNFAILTGKNGSGKTQLLELLAHYYSRTIPGTMPHAPQLPLEVTTIGANFEPDEIGYIPSEGRFSGESVSSLADLSGFRTHQLQQVSNLSSFRHDVNNTARARRTLKQIQQKTGIRDIDLIATAKIDGVDIFLNDIDVTVDLAALFVSHRAKMLEVLEAESLGVDKAGKLLGPAPWDVLNEALKVAGFVYEVISPLGTPLEQSYWVRLRDRETTTDISPADLSSGEKVLFQLVLWLFSVGKEGSFPKLLLLDEPDAHLHPSMTTQFLDVITEVLVNRYGVRVIMTTHSPSTVALAPHGSVFQIERGASRVTKVTSSADIISTLTAGLVTVSRATKFCFVEDDADVSFYETIHEILTDYGSTKDPMSLRPSPSIVFISASIGSGAQKIPGGSKVVAKWIGKLDSAPLDQTFLGIIDRDINNSSSSRVFTIGRYSIENYMLDPLVIFALLLEEGKAEPVHGVSISAGNEHLLRYQNKAALQAIADAICSAMESTKPTLATQQRSIVTYSLGQTISVPTWVVDYRGHDLLSVAQDTFGGANFINQRRLLKALQRCRLIPKELAELLATIQEV
jgi:ABC-type molybdenum transport system ATPase subunit/photorepair protein PhrA